MLPQRLRKGDTIGFVAPSEQNLPDRMERFENAKKVLQNRGFHVVYGKHIRSVDQRGSAGTAKERAEDINGFFKDPSIRAIWCMKGGETANETLDLLDYGLIKKNPKIFMGLSDVTVLLQAIHEKTGLVTFHFCNPQIEPDHEQDYFGSSYSQEEFKKRLIAGKIGLIPPSKRRICIRNGKAKGKIFGGNLLCLLKLAGTPYFPDIRGSILFLEGFYESPRESAYRITQLKHMNIFGQVAGVVIGHYYAYAAEEK
jgi:muramoyltetrapeptide carboxypeptidase